MPPARLTVLAFLALTSLTLLLLLSQNTIVSLQAVPWSSSSHSADSACRQVAQVRDAGAERWGREVLRASVAHAGSGARVRRAMGRLRGGKITVGVLGGSVTFGHGLEAGDKRYTDLIHDALAAAFPSADIVVVNGAVPATGTDYFSACYAHHVPAADLYLLETAINDFVLEASRAEVHRDTVTNTEVLVRELLKAGAAVVMFSTWGLDQAYINGADQHAVVAEYYDIPRISARAVLYPYIQAHGDEGARLFAEGSHLSARGHRFVADSIVDYLLDQACRPPYPPYALGGSELSAPWDPFALPPLRIRQRLGATPLEDPAAFCLSANVDTPDGWQLQAHDAHGFTQMEWRDKRYWGADAVGARATFTDIEVHAGFVGEGEARMLVGQWGYVSVGSVGVVAEGLERGRHNVTCVVDASTGASPEAEGGPHKVRIIAVIAS